MESIEEKISRLAQEAEAALETTFRRFDEISFENTKKVMAAFREFSVNEACFHGTTGYGYDDRGRDTLDQIYARVFEAEAAFVRHNIVSGTHALAIGLYGLLRPHDILLSATGKPYDTLDEVIGISGERGRGSLSDYGVEYREVPLSSDGGIDISALKEGIRAAGDRLKVIFIQRSKGYMDRKTLSAEEIGDAVKVCRALTDAYVVVDNCYGEFVDLHEPTYYGADLIIGSLIKNPGGGMAESGGYIAGTARAVELASYRLTTVGTGLEVGASLSQNRNLYKGFFFAPHVVASALKTAAFAAYIFERMGYEVLPKATEERHDIIEAIRFGDPEALCAFCRGIQYGSPVDAYVTPEPWAMPGYADPVIMAAGTFTQGASIELSADGPMRPPYTAFFQGGLTYESGKLGILSAAREILKACGEKAL